MTPGLPRLSRFLVASFLVTFFGLLLTGQAQVVIAEMMAQNVNSTVVDEDGQHSDWVELQNTGPTPVSLNGWYLTDDQADLQKWRFPLTSPAVTLAPGARLVVWCSGKNRKVAANKLHTNFNLERNGEYLGLLRPDGFTVEFEFAPAYPPQFNNSVYGLGNATTQQELLSETATGKARVPIDLADFQANFTGWNSSAAFDTTGWQEGQSGFGYDTSAGQNIVAPLLSATGNLQSAMFNTNASAFIRYIVNVPSPAAVTKLILKMKYDDGFVCYLNGNLIAQSLAPGGPTWNSTTVGNIDRADSLAASAETFNPTNAQNFLVAGDNVLAVQLLNSTAANDTALIRPQLLADVITGTQTGYLASPTPNAANAAAVTNFGPSISQVTDTAVQPTGGGTSAPLVISAKVVPTLRPLAASGVTLKWRIMYAAETAATMQDDGANGDVTAGDGIYTAQIPTTAMTPGQMLRWRIEAKDNTNIYSYDPPYPFLAPPANPPPVTSAQTAANDFAQYYGTVAVQPSVTSSQLPVLHWFVQNPSASQTTGGASCSFFYLGRFYDNVRADLHGQSSSGFPVQKKSHNLNFPRGNRFVWKDGQPTVRAINLLTNYADKTKTRNKLAWEAWSRSGHLMSHFCENIRVEQNGAFWGIYDLVEDGNEDFLERFGFNTYDALYKIYDTMLSTGQARQKTREDIDASKADYQALLNGINNVATRRLYAYDNMDIGALVNMHAVHALINNNDWGHKNFYMFRNTTGTGEWAPIPWDQDLSSGHTWQSAQNYFNDEIDSQRAIRGGAGNNMRTLMYDSPEMNRMFVRRMRTLMDEFYGSGTATEGYWETRIPEILDQLDPPNLPAGVKSDARLDLEKWGFWVHGSSAAIPFTDSRVADHTMRAQSARLLTANPIPPYVGFAASPAQGNNTTFTFTTGRRRYLYNVAGSNPASGADPIPSTAQPAIPTGITIETVDFSPASGNGEQEYFIIKNTSGIYIDVSGWRITGTGGATVDAVDYVFHGGTVIPPFISGSVFNAPGDVHAGRLHVARNPLQFRARTASPKGGEFRYVVGPYNGRLSARGGALELRNKAGDVVTSTTWNPAPTPSQTALRVTELNINPTAPTAAELQAVPGLNAGNFEFIEVTNTGATALNLAGASFDKGVTFSFPANFSLDAGERCVVVANQTAFQLRYGNTLRIAGEFEGSLDNNGETVRLLDASNEEVFEFRYNPDWYGLPSTEETDHIGPVVGFSMVTRTDAPAYDSYENPLTWALSRPANGTPAVGDTAYSNVYYGWLHDHFTSAEQATAIATPGEDADGDGRSNFEEYTQGTDPRVVDTGTLLSRALVTVGTDRFPAVRFSARAALLDVAWIVEASSDGVAWRTLGPELSSRVALDPVLDELTYRDSDPAGAGSRMFRVRARYLAGTETTATIENHAPITAADTASTRTAPVNISVLANDTDADNDLLGVQSVGTPAHGSAALDANGSITFTPDGTFTAAGGDTFTYLAADAFGGEVQGTVTITIANVAPVATPDEAGATSSAVTIQVLQNDTDADNDSLTITGVTQGQHGSVTINAGASVTFSPDASFAQAGGDLFTYTISDGFGGTASGTVTVTQVNVPPVAVNDTVIVKPGSITIPVLANDTDVDGNVLTISSVGTASHGTTTINDNAVTYIADGTFAGADSFTYTISDGSGGSASATVTVTNNAPLAVDDFKRVVASTASLIPVTSNDTEPDPGQSLVVTIATNPTQGTATVEGTSIRYTAGTNFTGTDTFTYAISDGFGGADTAEVKVVDELLASEPGFYRGLVSDASQASVGIMEVSLATQGGGFSAQLWHLGERYKAKAVFDSSGAATVVFRSRSGLTRNVVLQLAAENDEITGTLANGSSVDELKLKRFTATFGRKNPCPNAGSYTALLPVDPAHLGEPAYPQGCGFATMNVSSSGAVKVGGKLGDSTSFVVRGRVDQNGATLVHTALYKGPKGFICGEATFVSGDVGADQRGTLTWRKPLQQKQDASYPAGFSGSTAWQAARFARLAKGAPIFGPAVNAATLTMEFGGLATPITKSISVTASGLVVQNVGPDALKLGLNGRNGLFAGTYVHPRDSRKRSLGGVLYQKQPVGRGAFTGVSESGQTVTGDWMLSPP